MDTWKSSCAALCLNGTRVSYFIATKQPSAVGWRRLIENSTLVPGRDENGKKNEKFYSKTVL